MNKNIKIVPVSAEHLEAIARLEKLCFSEPWSKKSLELLTRRGIAMGLAAVDTSEPEAKLLGYVGMMTVLDEGQITNVAVLPERRGEGIGRALISALIGYCQENGFISLSLEVRESNSVAIRLYKRAGFKSAGKRKNFYKAPTEDGIVMTKDI